jgi:hypothetical protein
LSRLSRRLLFLLAKSRRYISKRGHAGRLVMAIYRFYVLNSDATLKGSATRLDFLDDSAAINHAEQMIGGHSVELWQDDRRVGRFASKRVARLKGVEPRAR